MNACTDSAIRQQALDVSGCFIVQAPAGSGKTELLTQRYLALLAKVDKPEAILAITFTRKAAQEMQQRILNKMRLAKSGHTAQSQHESHSLALAKQALAQNDKMKWQLLKNPSRLQIQTIDSFCAKIASALPLSSKTASVTNVSEDAFQLYEKTVENMIMSHDENSTALISTLLEHCDNDINTIKRLLCKLLANRDQWLGHIVQNSEAIKEEFNHNLQQINQQSLNKIDASLNDQQRQKINFLLDYANENESELKHLFINGHENSLQNKKDFWQGLCHLFLTQKGKWRKSISKKQGFPAKSSFKLKEQKSLAEAMKNAYFEVQQELGELDKFATELNEILYMPPLSYDEGQWQILQCLFKLLPLACARLKLEFQTAGYIDFTELNLAALEALGNLAEPSDLALALDYKIQHILVDEFQDTSSSQLKLLQSLTRGWQTDDNRSLFVVGDPMQSIYRFRNAQVGIFLQVQLYGLNDIKLTPLTLSSNFRSQEKLIDWFNQSFSEIFPAQSNLNLAAIHYSASDSTQAACAEDVECYLCGDDLAEAQHIADLIQQELASNNETQIAILARARNHLSEIFSVLTQRQIEFNAHDIEPLSQQPWILDLFSLLRAFIQPADRIAWLACLRAPFCGLDLESLHIIANHKDALTIWQRLCDENIINKLSINMQTRLRFFISIMQNTMCLRFRTSICLCVSFLWESLNAENCYTQNVETDSQQFFQLLQSLESENPLVDLNFFQYKLNSLYSNSGNSARVEIMTLHKAKGLEFDTVIMPALHKCTLKANSQLLLWAEYSDEKMMHLLLAPVHAKHREDDPIYRYIQRFQLKKDEMENRRLLYVAATRAKKKLIFSAIKQTEDSYKQASFMDYLQPHLIGKTVEIDHNDSPLEQTGHQMHRLALESFQNVHASEKINGDRLNLSLTLDKHAILGTLIHECLQQITNDGLHTWDNERLQQQIPYFKKCLIEKNLPVSELNFIISSIEKTLDDDKGRWILSPHTQAQSEFAITSVDNGQSRNLVIDRTFIDENGTRWIIDYKTTSLNEADHQDFIQQQRERHLPQLLNYKNALQQLYPEPIKLALYFPNESLFIECNIPIVLQDA